MNKWHMFLRFVISIAGLMVAAQVLPQSGSRNFPDNQNAKPKSFGLLSFDYISNSNVPGLASPDIRQPTFSPSAGFFSRWGADITIQGSFTGNSDDSLENYTSELDLILGFTIKPFKNLTLYPSYSRFAYSRNSSDLYTMFSNDFRIDVDYAYKFITLGLSSGYYQGNRSTFYTTVFNHYRIQTEKLFSPEGTLMLVPGLDLNFGDYEYLNLYYLDELRENPLFYAYLLYNYPALRRYVFLKLREDPSLTRQEVVDDYLEEQAQESIRLTSIYLYLPAYYMIGNWGVSIGLSLIIPVNQPEYLSDDVQFLFNAGVSYTLNFK